jgi:DNA repair protein RecO (recombination protein O)
MPLYTADALVLRTYKLGEADRIVVFLTADRGKKRGVAKSARRPRSRFTGALEPLTHVRVAYFEKETRELVSLNYAEPVRSPLSAPGEAVHYASYFAELIDEWAPADDPNETLYRLGASVVDAMALGTSPELLARYFEYWVLRLQGVYPPHLVCHLCGARFTGPPSASAEGSADLREMGAWLSPTDGVLTCADCAQGAGGRPSGTRLSPEALWFLALARQNGPRELAERMVTGRVLAELEALHRLLMARHLERELKSLRVLRELRRHGH